MDAAKAKAAVLIEALPYLQEFRGRTVVVKFGGAAMRPGGDLSDILFSVVFLSQVGIHTVAYFMIGTPTERSRRDVEQTIRYSIKLKPDFVMFNILTPFPGTQLFQEGVEEGVLDEAPWREFMRHPHQDFKAPLWDQHFSHEELRDLLHLAYRRFYWRPAFVVRNLLQIRRRDDLLRKAKAGVRLLLDR